MTSPELSALMNSPYWLSGGRAMLEFAAIGTAIWIIAAILRLAAQRMVPQWRYALAGLTLLALVSAAGVSVVRHWPMPVAVTTPIAVPVPQSPNPPAMELTSTTGAVDAPSLTQAAVAPTPATLDASLTEKLIRWLPWVWFAGVPFVALFVACGWVGAARLRGDSIALIDGELREVFLLCKYRLSVTTASIALCERLVAPIVVGILKPVILIPPSLLTSLSFEQWEMILLHELAHIRRWDNLFNLLQRIVETLLFFHPAVWWASRWMRLEREHCCDDIVLSRGATAQSYAETLAVLALPGLSPQLATAAMANHQLLARMRHILGSEDLPMAVTRRRMATALVVIAGFAALMTAGVHTLGRDASAEDDQPVQAEISFGESDAAESSKDAVDTLIEGAFFGLKLEGDGDGDDDSSDSDLLNRVAILNELISGADDDELTEVKASLAKTLLRLKERRNSPKSRADSLRRFAESAKSGRRALSDQKAHNDDYHALRMRFGSTSGTSRSWSAEQVTGPPNVDSHGDSGQAWAAKQADQTEEWIAVAFDEPRAAVAVIICESFNPGAVVGVDVGIADDNNAEPEIRPVWTSHDYRSSESSGEKKVTVIPLSTNREKIQGVTVHIDERRVAGWNEIDAIGFVDADSGGVHWATEAVASSSYADVSTGTTYGTRWTTKAVNLGWTTNQATGAPNVPEAGDSSRAWASAGQDNQPEWLELTYDPPVPAAAILVYESFNPGALSKITVQEAGGRSAQLTADKLLLGDVLIAAEAAKDQAKSLEAADFDAHVRLLLTAEAEKTIWEGTDPVQVGAGKGVAVISVPAGLKPIHKVKLHLDSPRVQGWNEIDAVGLLNISGEVQWAAAATASSTYGQSVAVLSDASVSFTAVPDVPVRVEAAENTKGQSGESVAGADHDALMREYNELVDKLTEGKCSKCHQIPHGWLRRTEILKESTNDPHHALLKEVLKSIQERQPPLVDVTGTGTIQVGDQLRVLGEEVAPPAGGPPRSE
jgi:beta-lactamase regulating signal transducer with metallopeptidase domain